MKLRRMLHRLYERRSVCTSVNEFEWLPSATR